MSKEIKGQLQEKDNVRERERESEKLDEQERAKN